MAGTYCPRCGAHLEDAIGPPGRIGCPQCGFVRYENPKVAAGVVVEIEGRILLVRRNHEPAYGRWSFPSGYVDAGESVEEAAIREVREETAIEVELKRLLGVYSRSGHAVVFVAYAGRGTGGSPRAGDEALELRLFDPDELPELAFEHDPAIIAAWRSGSGLPV